MKMRSNFSCICCRRHAKLQICYCLHKRSPDDLLHLCTMIKLTNYDIYIREFPFQVKDSFLCGFDLMNCLHKEGGLILFLFKKLCSCLNVAAARSWEVWKQVWRGKAESSELSLAKVHTFMVNNKLNRKVARNINRVSAQVNFCWLRLHTIYPCSPEQTDQI